MPSTAAVGSEEGFHVDICTLHGRVPACSTPKTPALAPSTRIFFVFTLSSTVSPSFFALLTSSSPTACGSTTKFVLCHVRLRTSESPATWCTDGSVTVRPVRWETALRFDVRKPQTSGAWRGVAPSVRGSVRLTV